jgi:hypothetical protein
MVWVESQLATAKELGNRRRGSPGLPIFRRFDRHREQTLENRAIPLHLPSLNNRNNG